MLPTRDDKFLLISLGAAAMAVFFAWQIGYDTGFRSAPTGGVAQTPAETDSVVGKITDITDTTIALQMFIPRQGDENIIFNSETLFEKIVPKNPEAYQNEIDAFDAKMQAARTRGTQSSPEDFPIPITFVKISSKDLHPGDIIQATIENVQTKNQLVARRVVVQPALPADKNATTSPFQ